MACAAIPTHLPPSATTTPPPGECGIHQNEGQGHRSVVKMSAFSFSKRIKFHAPEPHRCQLLSSRSQHSAPSAQNEREYIYILEDKDNNLVKVGRTASLKRALGIEYGAPFAHTSLQVRLAAFPELSDIYKVTRLTDNQFESAYGWSVPRFRPLLTFSTGKPRYFERRLIRRFCEHFPRVGGRREWFALTYGSKLCRHRLKRLLGVSLFKTRRDRRRCAKKLGRAPFSPTFSHE